VLKIIGGFVVYSFAVFGFGVYLQRMHTSRQEEAGQ